MYATRTGGCMVMSINAGYFIKEASTSFRRNWVMSFGAVITIFLSLLLIGLSLLIGDFANSMVSGVEDKVTVQVFIKDAASSTDVSGLQRKLRTNDLVKSVDFVSKEDALNRFKEQMKQSPDVIENLEGNPLPASLDIQLNDTHDVNQVVADIKAAPEFKKIADRPDNTNASIKYGQGFVQRLFSFTRVIRYVGIVFIVMLAVVSLIFINNTIRMAIYARRNELSIMRLVGASNWFIRAPFILEGIIQAIVGAILAIAVIVSIKAFLMPRIQESIRFMSFSVSNAFVMQIALILIVGGIIIGAFGSWLAMRKYLKI